LRLALSYPTPAVARVLTDATLGMIGGQYLDVTEDAADADALARLHALKTGRLIQASVLAATAVAEVDDPAWAELGADIGLLFQIVDDVLDATGTAEELGKTPGKDEASGKVTYVSLHGLDRARELADETRARVLARLDAMPEDTSVLAEIVATVRERRG
jgi:geranylgeranyl pyrophosphate synthase